MGSKAKRTRARARIGGSFLACLLLLAATAGAVAFGQSDEDCFLCHEGLDDPPRLLVTPESHEASMHGEMGIGCVDCHQDLQGFEGVHEPELAAALCTPCHEDAAADVADSVHGYARQRGNPKAPDCASCHGAHDILPVADPRSRAHGLRLAETCAGCHGNGKLTDGYVKRVQTAAAYSRSVHGRPDATGEVAATCADCHGMHRLRGAADPESSINRARVASTCGACHSDVGSAYSASIHGQALAAGVSDSPTCVDCHGEHTIQRTHGVGGIGAAALAAATCADCHNDPKIIARYDLDGTVVDSYEDSYHGWATSRDSDRAATCVSCHTAHEVLPAEHPDSSIHADRVVATCQGCHPRADVRFAASYTHAAASATANPVNRAIRSVYRVLIAVIIGGMLLHNLIILGYYARRRRREVAEGAWLQRFTRIETVQHAVLALSFIALVVTGFALRFPEAWWVGYLGALGMTETVRGNLHRAFGVVLIVASIGHLLYVSATARGRTAFRAMLPRREDLGDVADNLRFHSGRSSQHPSFDRFDYTQKAEYWALLWGTALMALTGLILWFPAWAVRILPAWAVPASQTVHYYEAWLATLAIVVWHFFFVMLHPEEYPMNWTWLNGKMSRRTAARHHARWSEARPPAEPEPGKVAARTRSQAH